MSKIEDQKILWVGQILSYENPVKYESSEIGNSVASRESHEVKYLQQKWLDVKGLCLQMCMVNTLIEIWKEISYAK